VLVHGSSGGLDSWNPVVPFLGGRFELWTYARRGYSPSDGSPRPKRYADDVADLQAVLDVAGGSAHVVGGSYGGTVALHAALTNGAGVQSVALFEPPLFASGPALTSTLDRFRGLLDADDVSAAMRLFAAEVSLAPAWLLDALADSDADHGDEAERDAAAVEAIGCLHDLEAMVADTEDVQRWAAVDCPVLLMQGSDTWAPMPDTMEKLASILPTAARVTFAGQSHFASHTAPEMVGTAIREFLNEHDK
jgi:pimeloyl-ACP methyl ester carboxylesterase